MWEHLEADLPTWHSVQSSNVNDKMEWLLNIVKRATNQFKSTKTIKTNRDFFDRDLENMRIEKNRLYKIAQLSNDSPDAAIKWQTIQIIQECLQENHSNKKVRNEPIQIKSCER